jgi:hypothetical protein
MNTLLTLETGTNESLLKTTLYILLCLSPLTASSLSADELGLNLYGLSYHFDRETANGTEFNEIKFGLGLNYRFAESKRFDFSLEGGMFKDSLRHKAKYVSLNVRYEVAKEAIKLGVLISAYRSDSVSENWVFGPIPVLALRYKNVGFNFVYIPEIPDINAYDSIGFYMTFHLLST